VEETDLEETPMGNGRGVSMYVSKYSMYFTEFIQDDALECFHENNDDIRTCLIVARTLGTGSSYEVGTFRQNIPS
jgi:hypothetical protein